MLNLTKLIFSNMHKSIVSITLAELPSNLKRLLPNLNDLMRHKGQNGKVGVLGGSEEYTGAPYYSAVAAVKCGADMSHVFTPCKEALIPIKCYSPEIIVHFAYKHEVVVAWLGALNSLVIGPGLGRDPAL